MSRLTARLALAEQAISARQMAAKGWRHFVTVDGAAFIETTQPAGGFDYERAVTGCDGELPADAQRFTRAEVAALEAAGWRCSAVHYADMQGEA